MGIADIMAAQAKAVADATKKAQESTQAKATTSAPTTPVKTIAPKVISYNVTSSGIEKVSEGKLTVGPTPMPSGYTESQIKEPVAQPYVKSLVTIARSGVEIKPVVVQSGFELQQQTSKQTQAIISQLESRRKGIVPSAMYSIEGEKSPELGFIISTKLLISEKQILKQQEEFNKQISSYPTGTTFKQTPTGYDVIIPQSEIDKERYASMNTEFNKINKAYKINPVLGFFAELGYGAVSSGEALLASGQNLLSKTGLVQPNTRYYPNFTDIIFEKKGADIWGKHPVFTAGAIFGEAEQLYIGGKVISAGAKASGTVIKWGGKQLLTSSLLKGTTEETILESGKTIVTPISKGLSRFLPESIKSSETIQNFEKWAVEGYRPGKTLVEVSKGTPLKLGEYDVQQFALKTDKSIPFLERRIWLSPTEQASYTSRIAEQGTIKISFPTSKQLGRYSEQLTMAGERETFQKGLLGGIKGRTATTFLAEDVLGKETQYPLKSVLQESRYGSYSIYDLNQPWKDVGYVKVKTPFKTMMEEGFTRETPVIYRPGAIRLESFEGFGKQTAPLSEKAVWELRKPGILTREALGNFLKDVRASQSELISLQKPSSILSKGGRLSGVTFDIPSETFGRGLSFGLSTGVLELSKISIHNQNEINIIHQIPQIKMNQISSNRQDIISEAKQDVFNISLPKMEQVQIKIQQQEQIRTTIPKLDLIKEQINTPVNMKIPRYEPKYPSTTKVKIPLWPPSSNLDLGASSTGGFKRRMKPRSKIWDLPIPKLSDLFGG